MADITPSIPLDRFRFMSASVVGLTHQKTFSNGHDARITARIVLESAPSASQETDFWLGAVCDGCGSSPHSEVGSKMMASLLVQAIRKQLEKPSSDFTTHLFWNHVKASLLDIVMAQAQLMHHKDPLLSISEYFMCTIVGYLASPTHTVVFNIGDGVVMINGMVIIIPPAPGNYPDYIAYNLFSDMHKPSFDFYLRKYSTPSINSLVVATDGFSEALAAAGKLFPGEDESVPNLVELSTDPKYWVADTLLQRTLNRMAGTQYRMLDVNGGKRLMKYPGLLGDDVTVVGLMKFSAPPELPK